MLNTYSIIKVSGTEAERFLQGQLSNDVTLLKENPWQLSCYCNQKGRIIAFLWLAFYQNQYFLCLPTDAVTLTFADLKKFGAFSKVDISITDEYKLAAIFDKNDDISQQKPLIFMNFSESLALALIKHNISQQPCPTKKWELANINNGLPIITHVQQEKFTPHQLNLQTKNALAFKKGCYRGQEIVARMEYLGKLKQQMYRVEIQSSVVIETLSPLCRADDKIIGEVVNLVALESNKYLALAVLNKAAIEAANAGIIQLKDKKELRIL